MVNWVIILLDYIPYNGVHEESILRLDSDRKGKVEKRH